MKKGKRKSLKDAGLAKFSEVWQVPKELSMALPRFTMVGNLNLNIESHLGIVVYEKDSIQVNTNSGLVKIFGQNLTLTNITSDEINVNGLISQILFEPIA